MKLLISLLLAVFGVIAVSAQPAPPIVRNRFTTNSDAKIPKLGAAAATTTNAGFLLIEGSRITMAEAAIVPGTPVSGFGVIYFKADGRLYTKDDTGAEVDLSSGSPSGADTQIQFNDSSAFGGDAGLTYNKATDTLNVRTQLVIGATGVAGSLWAFDDQGNAAIRVADVVNRDLNIGSINGQDNLVFWAKEIGVNNPIRMNFDGWDFTGPHLLFYKLAARAPTGWSEPLVDVKSTNGLQFFLIDSNGNFGIRTNLPQSALHVHGDLTVNGGLSVNTFTTDLLIVLSNVVEFTASANHQLDHNGPLRWNGSNSLAQHTALSFTNIYKTTNSHGSITLEGPASGGPYNVTNLLGGAIGSVPTLFATNGGPYATSVIVSVADNTVLEENWKVRFSRGTNFVDILYTVLTR